MAKPRPLEGLSIICQTFYVVGGSGPNQTAFRVPKTILGEFPIMKEPSVGRWVECPGTEDEAPDIGKRRKDLYLEAYSPRVVKHFLVELFRISEERWPILTHSLSWRARSSLREEDFVSYCHLCVSLRYVWRIQYGDFAFILPQIG